VLIKQGEHLLKLITAVHLVVDSPAVQWMRNVGAEFCRRWMEKKGLVGNGCRCADGLGKEGGCEGVGV
jgi:hypothetical protein